MYKFWPSFYLVFLVLEPEEDSKGMGLDQLEVVLKTLFSWLLLMPIAVIVSGILLAGPFKLQLETPQRFRIPIPTIFNLEANKGEVVLGFAGFIITLVLVGVVGGQYVYIYFRTHFGLDPGHFNSLCILSSFITVLWSSLLWLLNKIKTSRPDPVTVERDQKIAELSRRFKEES